MLKLLLVGFLSFVSGQGGTSCGTGFVYNSAVSSCLPTSPGSNCCDASLASCQDAIKLCMASGAATGTNCQALACPTQMPSPSCCDPALITCQIAIRTCLTNTSNPQLCQGLACSTVLVTVSVTPSPIRTQSQYSTTATVRASPNAMFTFTGPIISSTTPKQTLVSNTPRQTDATVTTTYKQTDSSSSMKPADPIMSVSMKPSSSLYPTRFVKYSFSIRPRPSQYVFPVNMSASVSSSIIFPKANYILLRDPAKLQELQIILACILRMPLEGIEITNIATNSMDVPFDASIARLNSNGQIVCINLPSVAIIQGPALRRLQIADTTVSYNILNANNMFMIDKNSFATTIATDSNMLSYASSVGSNNPIVIPPIILFTLISPDPSTIPAQSASAGSIVGGIFGGILVAGLLGVIMLAIIHLRNRTSIIFVKKTSVKKLNVDVSNPLNNISSTNIVFNPIPTQHST